MTPGKHVEYRVKEVRRYIVTRHETVVSAEGEHVCGSNTTQGSGEYPNWDMAYQVGYALARLEHEQLGYELGDERVRYPQTVPTGEQEAPTEIGLMRE